MKFLIALAVSLLFLVNCSSLVKLKDPKVTLASLKVQNPTAQGATLVFGVQVENPNNIELKVDEVVYDLEVAGKSLSSGTLDKGARVSANATEIIDVPIGVKYTDLFDSLVQVFAKQSSPYRIKGSARMGLFNIPFDEKGELKFEKGKLK